MKMFPFPGLAPLTAAGGLAAALAGVMMTDAGTRIPPRPVRTDGGFSGSPGPAALTVAGPPGPADIWRREKRIIDLHMHIDGRPERFDRAVRIMDQAGVGIGVNLSGGTVTPGEDGAPSAFAGIRALAEERAPGRFVHYMNLDYTGWDRPDFSEQAVRQIEEGHRLGAAGLKEYKRLGLFLKDGAGRLIRIDDPKLDAVWKKCGELGMPVSIHVADPRAFWDAFDEKNERWKELKDHRNWWFGDPAEFPDRMELLEGLNRVIGRHPGTTFVCVHFANNAEDLAWVDRTLDRFPNMMADLAARIPELGRHAPEEVRRIFTKHADRILFATDFMVYERLILGSAGDAERPTDAEALTFYQKCWRWMETDDRGWAHMTPIQGDWPISSISLPPEVSRKIYFDNARRLLARSLPLPVISARPVAEDFGPDGRLDEPAWQACLPVRVDCGSANAAAVPALSTAVRALWSREWLYLGWECPFTELTVFSPEEAGAAALPERIGLWEKDVVEAFISTGAGRPGQYTEFQWAPNRERLDLKLDLPARDFAWSSGMQSAVTVDHAAKVWRVEARIPLKALTGGGEDRGAEAGGVALAKAAAPEPGTRWRVNFYRHDAAAGAGLAWSPTLTTTFHKPERFGWLEFTGP